MISIEEIRRRIEKRDENSETYSGFRFDATHSQTETNIEIHNHNKEVLKRFEDLLDIDFISTNLHCWKGFMCWEDINYDMNGNELLDIEDFSGWTTEDIIAWLIKYKRKEIDDARIITTQQRYEVLKRQKWKCNQCGEKLKYNKDSSWEGKIAHIDHIHPYSKRYSYPNGFQNINESSNLQALCPDCNLKKGKKEIH